MLGAIIGDIVGSRFEFNNIKTKDFEFLTYKCFPTDDSIMTLAVAQTMLISKKDFSDLSENAIKCMQSLGRQYPDCGYGNRFNKWIFSDDPKPYNSFGNGAAMRVSPAGIIANSLKQAKVISHKITEITHSHPEGIKGAEAVAASIYMAKTGSSILEIRDYIDKNYYPMNFTLGGIRDEYKFDETCQGSVPQALMAFFESLNFEDAIRNAISIGGDSDTIAAICGSVAEAYYGIPSEIRKHAITFLDERLLNILIDFENVYASFNEKTFQNLVVRTSRNNSNIKGKERGVIIEQTLLDTDNELNNSNKITSKKLFNHLFEVCNILRGPINQDEYKSYVIPILFYKRISDVYDEEYECALLASDNDREYALAKEMHSFNIPEGCHWEDVRSVSKDVGKAIVHSMLEIEKANPESLSGVFSSFDDANWTDKSKLTDERLKNVIEHMSLININTQNYPSDVMGDSYEYLIKKFADMSKKNAGEFYTPRSIVKLMVRLLDPQPGETVYDPACGTGGMLIEAIHHMKNNQLHYGRIFGQENNISTSAIAKMNLYLHGGQDIKIAQGDTLRNPLFLECGKLKTFDCVLANPPFGSVKWGATQFENDLYGRNIWGCPTDSNADFAWLQHMVKSMDPISGRCAVVLPQGVLSNAGRVGDMRKKLICSDKLEAVITLTSGVFYNTGVSACILFLNNKKNYKHKGHICLIDGTGVYTPKRSQNELSNDNVKTLYDLYANYEDVVDLCKIVSFHDIEEAGFNLSVKRYIKKKKKEILSPTIVRRNYYHTLDLVNKAEKRMSGLLIERGYVNE